MNIVLFILGVISVTSARSNDGNQKERFPFSWMPPAPRPSMGQGQWGDVKDIPVEFRCTSQRVSLSEKLRLVAEDNDHNHDGVVKYADLYYDVAVRYDKNGDGILTEEECVAWASCRYGDTEQMAQFFCGTIFRGEANVSIDSFNRPPFVEGVPLVDFLANARRRYERFYENRCTNQALTMDEKLSRNAANNDYNKDGQITTDDIYYDVATFYDTNKDGNLTKAEFVVRYTCNYGDSGNLARFLWTQLVNSTTIDNLPITFFTLDKPIPTEQYKAALKQSYDKFQNSQVERYIRKWP